MAQSQPLSRDEKYALTQNVIIHPINGTSEFDNSTFYADPAQIEEIIKLFSIETGAPTILNICLTSTPKIKETKDNQICNISYPIIPPVFDFNIKNDEDKSGFVSSTQDSIKQKIEEANQRQLSQSIKGYAQILSSTIIHDLALRYVEAKKKAENTALSRSVRTKEHKIMNQLANLKIFKKLNFDLDLFEKCSDSPEIIPDKKGSYTFRYPDGKTIPATYKEFQSSGRYIRGLDQYKTDKAILNTLLNYIEQYKNYYINQFEENQQPAN